MTREDIIRMAHEAGLHIATDHDWMPIIALAYAQKFAELVAAATLKNSVMTDEEYEQAMADEGQRRMLSFDNDVRALIKEAVEAEREACAKVCDEKVAAEYATGKVDHNEMGWTQACAFTIRERGAPALERLNKAAEDNGEPL
jgi:hypothetical protein